MRIVHLITDLDSGGAETQLARLLETMPGDDFEPLVVSMLPPGVVGERIAGMGVPVKSLGMRRGVPDPVAMLRLRRVLRDFRPDLLQTWLYHADLLGIATARLSGVRRVVWNIRCADMDLSRYGRSTRWTLAVLSRLSRLPRAVVTNSATAKEYHLQQGYRPRRFEIIPNGFDTGRFRPDPEARAAVRAELGLPGDCLLAGLVARYDPMKDHATFMASAGLAARSEPGLHFALCGAGVTPGNAELAELAARHGLAGRVHMLGRRGDVPRLMAALDVLVSSSVTESFPNVVGEAMACAVPVAATDAGDSALIVGETGRVAPRSDPGALGEAMLELLRLFPEARRELGQSARRRVRERFSIQASALRYAALYTELAAAR